MEEQTINQRLRDLITSLGLSQNQFGQQAGISSSLMSQLLKDGRNFGIDIAQKIISNFPRVNSLWLLTGIGEMFNSEKGINGGQRGQEAKNLVPDKGYIKTTNYFEGKEELNQAILIATEEELGKRVRDLEYTLVNLEDQLRRFGQTWARLLNIDLNWIPMELFKSPRKSMEYVNEKIDNGRPLIKDGVLITVFDSFSIKDKIQYFKELETLRTRWQFELDWYINLVYKAVYEGGKYFNHLVTGAEELEVSEEKMYDMKHFLSQFIKGQGLE